MTAVRNGYTSSPSGYDVGGPGLSGNYNNSVYMTFPGFALEAGSTISSATMSYAMTGWDWRSAVTIYLQACASAGTPSNQVGCTGTADGTNVPESTLTSVYAATNTAKQMYASGKYFLKMYCANGNNRKSFTSTPAVLTVTYTPPTAPTAPTGAGLSPHPFEGALSASWTKGSNGVNNPVTGHDVQYRTSSNGSSWGTAVSLSAAAATTSMSIPAATVSGWARGTYVQVRVGSKSAYAATVYSAWSASVRKNRLPATPTAAATAKTCYAPGETIRVTFASTGDEDGNLSRFEAALSGSETIVGTQTTATARYVDISTASGTWTPGAAYQFRVRAKDALGALSAWSALTPAVMVGLPMHLRLDAGGVFRRAVSMKVCVPGMGVKSVKSAKIAPAQGGINKTIF